MIDVDTISFSINGKKIGTQTKIDVGNNTTKYITSLKVQNNEIYCPYTGVTVLGNLGQTLLHIDIIRGNFDDILTALSNASISTDDVYTIIFGIDFFCLDVGTALDPLYPFANLNQLIICWCGFTPDGVSPYGNIIRTERFFSRGGSLDQFYYIGYCDTLPKEMITNMSHKTQDAQYCMVWFPWAQIRCFLGSCLEGQQLQLPEEITLGTNVTSGTYLEIDYMAFRYNPGLKKLTVQSSLPLICEKFPNSRENYDGLFNNMVDLEEVYFNVPYMSGIKPDGTGHSYAREEIIKIFYQCGSLKKVVFPPSMLQLGANCLSNCTSLSEVTLSNNLTKIGNNTITATPKIQCTIPLSCTTYGMYVFNCGNYDLDDSRILMDGRSSSDLMNIYNIYNYNNWKAYTLQGFLRIVPGIRNNGYYEKYNVEPASRVMLTNIIHNKNDIDYTGQYTLGPRQSFIPEPIVVGDNKYGAFEGDTRLVTVWDDTSSSDASFFLLSVPGYNNSEYRAPNIPTVADDKWARCFKDCTNLSMFALNQTPARISESMFEGCTNLSDITFRYQDNTYWGKPNRYGLWTVGEKAFKDSGITDTSVYNIMWTYAGTYDNQRWLYICDYAFANCLNLEHLNIPAYLTRMESEQVDENFSGMAVNAFSGCTNLIDVTFNRPQSEIEQCLNYPWGIDPSIMVFPTE